MKYLYIIIFFIFPLMIDAKVVEIVKGIQNVHIKTHGKKYKIERTSNPNDYLTNTFALTSRPSPPFFIQPFLAVEGVETYGELEVLDFISHKKGIFIDARLENWYLKSAIPTAINIPFKIFLSESNKREEVLKSFGAQYDKDGTWDFSKTETILLYCNGAWCGQSPTAIKALAEIGYPKNKMKYYRGGMQAWQLLGLTTIVPRELK